MSSIVPAYWYVSSNAGDNLTPWLLGRLGKTACYLSKSSAAPKYIVSGSILAEADGSATVWGAGIGSMSEPINPAAKLLAVRGPLSRYRAMSCGAECPPIFGDPGLLVLKFFDPSGAVDATRIGMVPHFVDQERIFSVYQSYEDVRLISILEPVDAVLAAMASCSLIVSSSLHGLVFAVALGIPLVWAKFSDGIAGDGSKFLDFFLSLTGDVPRPVDLRGPELPSPTDLWRLAHRPPPYNIEPFWEACPFR